MHQRIDVGQTRVKVCVLRSVGRHTMSYCSAAMVCIQPLKVNDGNRTIPSVGDRSDSTRFDSKTNICLVAHSTPTTRALPMPAQQLDKATQTVAVADSSTPSSTNAVATCASRPKSRLRIQITALSLLSKIARCSAARSMNFWSSASLQT